MLSLPLLSHAGDGCTYDCIFASIGETLLDTFDKMYEALDRRYLVEEKRKKDFTAKEMYHKVSCVGSLIPVCCLVLMA